MTSRARASLSSVQTVDDVSCWTGAGRVPYPWWVGRPARFAMEFVVLRTQRADVRDARAHDPWNHDLVVTTPEGPRIVAQHVAHPERTDPLDLGDGTSAIFRPVSLSLFASEVESKTPGSPAHVPPERRPLYVADVRLAASAVEQALRFLPAGQSHAPLTIYPSDFQRRVAQLRAPQLSHEALSARFTFLMLLVEEWEG